MFTVSPGMRICPVGTSITAGGLGVSQPQGWWVDAFAVGKAAMYGAQTGVSITGFSSAPLRSTSTNPPRATRYPSLAEIGGAKLADIITGWSSLVTSASVTDAIVLEGNINDVYNGGGAPTAEATFKAQLDTIIGLCAGYSQVFWLGAMLGYIDAGENDTLFSDAFNTNIDTYNGYISEKLTAAGSRFTFCNIRPALKTWLTANNPTHLGKGILTVDGVHLNYMGLGKVATLVQSSGTVQWAA